MIFNKDPTQPGGIGKCLVCTTCEEKPKTCNHLFIDCPILEKKTDVRLEVGRLMLRAFNWSSAFASKIASNEAECKHMSNIFVELIMKDIKNNKNMKKLSKDIKNIKAEYIVRKTVDTIMKSITGMSPPEDHIHIAPTQSGKSAFKALKTYVYTFMNVSVVVVTKGMGESIELAGKFSIYLSGSRHMSTNQIFSPYTSNPDDIERAFMAPERACVLIIPCTYQKIQYAEDILTRRLKFATGRGRNFRTDNALILDEADATTNRSESNTERNEVALENCMTLLKPSVTKVTATPIPFLLPILLGDDLQVKPIITTLCKKTDNYVGIENVVNQDLDRDSLNKGFSFAKFKPQYEVSDQRNCGRFALFLDGGKRDKIVKKRNKFPDIVSRNSPTIPKTNEQCIHFIRNWIEKNERYQLMLIDTNAWVNAKTKNKEGIFHQAAGIQDYFYKENIKIIVIVVHADNIFYRRPGHKYGFECMNSYCNLLDTIDPNTPILTIAYNAMKRSRSFRSDNRVPSAMIFCLGKGQSNENCRQAVGRVTGKGMNILLRNHNTNKVLLLCPKDDFYIVKNYDPFVKEMITWSRQTELSPDEVRSKFLSSKHNFLHGTKRKTGNYCIKADPHQNGNAPTTTHQASKPSAITAITTATNVAANACTTAAAPGPSTIPNILMQSNCFATRGVTENSDDNNNERPKYPINFLALTLPTSNADRNDDDDDDSDSHEAHLYNPGHNGNKEEVRHILAPPGKLGLGIYKPPDDGIPAVVRTVEDSSSLVGKVQVDDKLIAVDDEDVLTLTDTELLILLKQKSMNHLRKLTILRTTVGIVNPNSMPINRNVQSEDKDGRKRNEDEAKSTTDEQITRTVVTAKKQTHSRAQGTILVASSKRSNSNRKMTTRKKKRKRSPNEVTIIPTSSKKSCGGENEQYDVIDLTADNNNGIIESTGIEAIADNNEIIEVINTKVVVKNEKIVYVIDDDDDDDDDDDFEIKRRTN